MGGLVARYFIEALGGWEVTRALITFGTPYRGSVNAIDFLAHGFKKGIGPFKVDLSEPAAVVDLGAPAAADLPVRR